MVNIDDLQETCTKFFTAWSARDRVVLFDLWDMDDPECSYLSARSEHRLTGADAVRGFIESTLNTFDVIRLRPRNIHARRLDDDLGSLFAEADWALGMTGSRQPLGGTFRVSVVLRRRGEGWRLCHYAESPLAPIVELRQFYQQVAADGHGALT